MSSYSRGDVSFLVQTKGAERPEQYPGMPYMDFWGDQYEWTSMLPLSWKLLSTNHRLRPPKSQAQEVLSWWNSALHLLAFGIGWTNLALGLQQWREMGYPTANPVLRFIWETYGRSIEALEVFLVTRPDYNYQFIQSLQRYGFDGFEPDEANRAQDYENPRLLEEKAFLDNARRVHNFGPRWSLAEDLLSGGDGLHLSHHFEEYVGHETAGLHPEDFETLFLSEKRIGIELPIYRSFHARLTEAVNLHQRTYSKTPVVTLYIKSLGHIGDFHRSSQTGRFYLVGEERDLGLQIDLHHLGNLL